MGDKLRTKRLGYWYTYFLTIMTNFNNLFPQGEDDGGLGEVDPLSAATRPVRKSIHEMIKLGGGLFSRLQAPGLKMVSY
jgi:hypothetical protein